MALEKTCYGYAARLYRKGGWGFRRPAAWIGSIKIPSIVASDCPGRCVITFGEATLQMLSPPMPNAPGRFRRVRPGAGLGNHGALQLQGGFDSEMEWLIESIFHRRMTEVASLPFTPAHVAEYSCKFTHPGQIHPVSLTCQLDPLSYLPFSLTGGLCLVLSGRLTWADGAS